MAPAPHQSKHATITDLDFPSPVGIIALLLLALFGIETAIMYALPHLLPIRNPYLENLADATLLTLLFTPVLYRWVFKPFQRAALLQKGVTEQVLAGVVDGVVIVDGALRLLSLNGAAAAMFGYREDELLGSHLGLILEAEALAGLPEPASEGARTAGAGQPTLECGGRRKDGSRVALELSLGRVQLAGNWLRLGILRDISARREGEARIASTLSLLNATLESTADGILVRDLAGRVVVSNRRFAQLWRIPPEAMATRDVQGLRRHVLDQLKEPRVFVDMVERQRLDPAAESCDILTFKDGRYLERVTTPQIIDGKIVGQVICCRDITDHKNLEHQLRHSQKMEALGTLAGGVAHDFNNILTVIMGYCKLTSLGLDQASHLRKHLNQIMAAAERATSLTNSLLAYSRKQTSNPMPIDLNRSVQQVEKFLARLIGEEIELVTRLSDENLTVLADGGQLEQVLMNLAANGRDAMAGKGCLSIATGRIRMDQEFVRLHGYGTPGEFAVMTVSDTGCGMDEATREKIFEPFFTTKELGQGTGLGLSIAYGIVKQHAGYINVYSEPGHGTTFNIYLPLSAGVQQAPAAEQQAAPGGTETILLAEDDPNVRALVRTVLSAQGYRVIEACHGEEAVAKFAERRDHIDLLILDVVMPKKNGRETYLEVRALKPDARVLFISGYTAEIIDHNHLVEQGLHLVNKPVLPNHLLAKVREVLDHRKQVEVKVGISAPTQATA